MVQLKLIIPQRAGQRRYVIHGGGMRSSNNGVNTPWLTMEGKPYRNPDLRGKTSLIDAKIASGRRSKLKKFSCAA